MRKETFERTCTIFVMALVIVLFFSFQIPKKIGDFFSGLHLSRLDTYVYTDIPIDIMSDANRFTNSGSFDLYTTTNLSDDVIANGAALVSNRSLVEDKFENSALVGYYSTAFFMTKELSQSISQTYKNQKDNDVLMIDFNEILSGFLEDKTWQDIGYNIDGKINIKAFYQNKSEVYYKLLTQQVLSGISGEIDLTPNVYSKYETELNEALNKIGKATQQELEEGTIYICCEQSQIFKNLYQKYIPSYSDIIACIPICYYWNNEELESYSETLQNGYYSMFQNFGFRNPTNSNFSLSADGHEYEARMYIDIPHNEYAMDSVYMAVDVY